MNLADLVFQQAPPEGVALITSSECHTFAALEAAVAVATTALLEAGLPRPERSADGRETTRIPRIGLACPNGAEHVILALAILRAGGCLVPIASELAAPEREAIIQTVGLDAVILQHRMSWPERLSGPGRSVPLRAAPELNATLFLDLLTPEEQAALLFDEQAFAALNPAFIRFSSGTTGQAKGVILSHETLLARIESANRNLLITPRDRVVWILSMAHHFAVSIMLYLLKGAATIIVENHHAEEILTAGIEHRGTLLYGSPFHHALLAAETSGRPWPSLRVAVSTAAALPENTAHAFEARFGVALSQALGVIEVGLPLINLAPGECPPTSVGRPAPHIDVELRDPVSGALIPRENTGTPGELYLRCPGMLDAYLHPWRLRSDILAPGGWFRSGDLAQWEPCGALSLVGRLKTVINVGGMKCFPEEIEAHLLTHPGVAEARVYGREHPRFGMVPVAEVVPRSDPVATPSCLVAHCRKGLASFKIPVEFRFVSSLPRTASGKIQRH